tara:strand:+ start:380 stop:667 length:288 start_codon:yes stop_codon:yes gene_type:complete
MSDIMNEDDTIAKQTIDPNGERVYKKIKQNQISLNRFSIIHPDELQKVYREEDFNTPTSRFSNLKLNCPGAPREKNSNDLENKDLKLTKNLFADE